MLEQNIYKFLSEANVHLSKGKEIELQPTMSISLFFKVFDLTRRKIYKFIWSMTLIGEFAMQPKIIAISKRHFRRF